MLRTIIVGAAGTVLICVAAASGASSRVATPISCGLKEGAPWTLVPSSFGRARRGSLYYVEMTSNLSCREVSARVAQLTRLTPSGLRRLSFIVSTGERLRCLTALLPKDIHSLRPRTAWGWCGTDVARVARLGVQAAAGTEFFWATADKRRGF